MLPFFGLNYPYLNEPDSIEMVASAARYATASGLTGAARWDWSFPRVFREPDDIVPDTVIECMSMIADVTRTAVVSMNPGPDGGDRWAWKNREAVDYDGDRPVHVLDPGHVSFISDQVSDYLSYLDDLFDVVYIQPAHERNIESGEWLPVQPWVDLIEKVVTTHTSKKLILTNPGTERQSLGSFNRELETMPRALSKVDTTSFYLDNNMLGKRPERFVGACVQEKYSECPFPRPTIIVETGLWSSIYNATAARRLLLACASLENVIGVCLYGTQANEWRLPI